MIGALVIKHKLNLTDGETLQTISENPYMQFFLGLEVFHPAPLFSESLFSEVRKRLGREPFEAFNELIIRASHPPLGGKPSEEAEPEISWPSNRARTASSTLASIAKPAK